MHLVCLDLEGVLVPEIWIAFAERSGIDALKATTRDIPDYDELMAQRLSLLDQHGLKLADVQKTVSGLRPLPDAKDFLYSLRGAYQVVIVSDTFYEFAMPLMRQLDYPTLLCHRLDVAEDGQLTGYRLRQSDPKRQSVSAFKSLNYHVIAAGDSYNDTSMLEEADVGILFRPPQNVVEEFPQYPIARNYAELRGAIDSAAAHLK